MNCYSLQPYQLIALDAEFAEGRELLELAVVDFTGQQVMLQRFRPGELTEWNDVKIHGITPEMVKDSPSFEACLPDIQKFVDSADYIVGFAVAENDLAKMKRQGVANIDKKKVVELRDWFWHCYGREAGLDYAERINLEKCCNELSVKLADDEDTHFHAAIFDTRATLEAFRLLLSRFVDSHPNLDETSKFDDIYDLFIEEFTEEKENYDRKLGAGYASISLLESGMYKFRVSQQELTKGNVIASIPVASRKKALLHFGQLFTGEIQERSFTFAKLSPKKLRDFKNYTNEFQGEEDKMASKLLRLSKMWKNHGN